MKRLTLAEVVKFLEAQQIQVKLVGNPDYEILGIHSLKQATPEHLSFLANLKYAEDLAQTDAGAVLVKEEQLSKVPNQSLVVSDPYLAYAKVTALFATQGHSSAQSDISECEPRIHPSAYVDPSATIEPGVTIGPFACIEKQAVIRSGADIGAHSFVGQASRVGEQTKLHSHVTLYHGCQIGSYCTVHSQAVIGADGFGFAPTTEGWVKIHQLGGVSIGNGVEIGAGTTIDRGALEDTIIGHGVILDNQIQIAHNVNIGDFTAIAGCTAVAGSTMIGKHCTIAGMVGIVGHLQIVDHVHITAMTLVTGSILEPGAYSGGTGHMRHQEWKKSAVRFRQLDHIYRKVKQLDQNK